MVWQTKADIRGHQCNLLPCYLLASVELQYVIYVYMVVCWPQWFAVFHHVAEHRLIIVCGRPLETWQSVYRYSPKKKPWVLLHEDTLTVTPCADVTTTDSAADKFYLG